MQHPALFSYQVYFVKTDFLCVSLALLKKWHLWSVIEWFSKESNRSHSYSLLKVLKSLSTTAMLVIMLKREQPAK